MDYTPTVCFGFVIALQRWGLGRGRQSLKAIRAEHCSQSRYQKLESSIIVILYFIATFQPHILVLRLRTWREPATSFPSPSAFVCLAQQTHPDAEMMMLVDSYRTYSQHQRLSTTTLLCAEIARCYA